MFFRAGFGLLFLFQFIRGQISASLSAAKINSRVKQKKLDKFGMECILLGKEGCFLMALLTCLDLS